MSEGGGGGPLREIAAVFGFEWDDKELEHGKKSIASGIELLKQFGAVFAASELVMGMREFAEAFTQQATNLVVGADRLGVTAEAMQELEYAGRRGKIGAEQMQLSLFTLSRQADAAAKGQGRAAAAFHALGVSARGADGQARPVSELMSDLAEGFSKVDNPAKRATLAQELFGRSGRRMLSILHEGEGGVADLRKELEELGGGMSEKSLKAAEEYEKQMIRWDYAMMSVKSTIAAQLLPVMSWLQEKTTKMVVAFHKWTEGTQLVNAALVVLGATGVAAAVKVLAAWLPTLAPFLLIAAAIGLLVLIVDDLITMFKGGESVIGEAIDELFGAGAAKTVVKELTQAWKDFLRGIDVIADALARAWASAGSFFQGIKEAILSTNDRMAAWFTQLFDTAKWVAGQVKQFFVDAWDGIINKGSEMFAFLIREVSRVWDVVASVLKKVHIDIGNPLAEAGLAANAVVPAAGRGVGAPTVAPVSIAGSAPNVTQNRSVTNQITVNGTTNPDAVAREVQRRIAEAERNERDADHPLLYSEAS